MKFLVSILSKIKEQISDDFQRKRQQMIILLFILGTISFVMSILNIVTQKEGLLISTAAFSVISYIAVLIGIRDKSSMKLTSSILTLEVAALFTFFIITGGTEGFSTIWLLLLPGCGMFALGRKWGSAFAAGMFVVLVFFFYTPIGKGLLLCTDYTQSFMMRFPIVYIAFWAVGYFLEYIREETYKQLSESRSKYEFLSNHDALTELYNRIGFNREMDKAVKECNTDNPFALLIIDIDHFKSVNDMFGHPVGDIVLKKIAKILSESLKDEKAIICRWGGEEFAILLFEESAKIFMHIAENLRVIISQRILDEDNRIMVTVSIGGVRSDNIAEPTPARMVINADNLLYYAKENGRNQVKCR